MAALITQKEYARRRGVTPSYINKLVREGRIVLKNGLVDPKQADAARGQSAPRTTKKRAKSGAKRETRNAKRPAVGRPPRGSSSHSLTEGRAQKVYWEALQSKLEYERAVGTLLPKAEVIEAERRKNANIRTRIRGMARSLAPLLARTTTPAECESLLLSEIDRQLFALSADPLGLEPSAASPQPSAEEQQGSGLSASPLADAFADGEESMAESGVVRTSAIESEATV